MNATQRSQALLTSPQALLALRRGFEKLATPLASTLGPSQRFVINEISRSEIELLNDSETIATRMIDIKERGENVGAMMLRNMVMQLHEKNGDGAATATVLAREMLRDGTRLLAAGVNPVIMRRGIERGVAIARQKLQEQALTIDGPEMFSGLATSMLGDPELGKIVGEMFDMMGDNPAFVVNDSDKPGVVREYASGGRWVAVPGDRLLVPEGKIGIEFHQPLVMVVDEELTTIDQVRNVLELVAGHPDKLPLVIVAREIKDAAREALVLNHIKGTLNVGVALLRSGLSALSDDMSDIALLTGARVFSSERGDLPRSVQWQDLGQARKISITTTTLLVVDGHGDQSAVRKRVAELRKKLQSGTRDEDWDRERIRIGRLSGGVGVLKVGGVNEHDRDARKKQVNKVLRALEGVQAQGVIPGGGVGYLNCIEAIQKEAEACPVRDEAAGLELVAKALIAPFAQIVQNSGGGYPPLVLAQVRASGSTYGFDGFHNDYPDMIERGIIDSVKTAIAALDAAASVATMAISTDMIIMM